MDRDFRTTVGTAVLTAFLGLLCASTLAQRGRVDRGNDATKDRQSNNSRAVERLSLELDKVSESVADFRRAVRLQESTAQQTSQQSQWAGLYQQGYDTGLSDMVGASMDVLRAGSERRSVELRWLNPLAKSANERLAGADTPPNGVPWDARSSTQVRFTYPAGSVRPDLEFDVVILPARVGSDG